MSKTLISDLVWGPQIFFHGFFQAIILCNFQENLYTKYEKNNKKPNFGSDFNSFAPNLGPKTFFVGFISTNSYT